MNATATAKNTWTTPQRELMRKLIAWIAEHDEQTAQDWREHLNTQWRNGRLDRAFASRTITALQESLGAVKRTAATAAAQLPEVPEGRYAVDNEDGATAFYLITARNGRTSVSVYKAEQPIRLGRAQAATVLRKVEAAGVEAARNRFADETARCWRCGTQLTDAESRARRMGPICYGKVYG